MRIFSLALTAVALIVLSAGADRAVAQGGAGERIDKVSNQRLTGSSYASLRGLSYQQCERRCLADRQCVALEHVRGGAGANASQCRLFSSAGAAQAAAGSDIGYKRSTVAKKAAPRVTTAPPPPPPSSEPRARSAPKAAPPPPLTSPGPDRKVTSQQMRKAEPPPSSAPPPGGAGEDRRRAAEEMARRQSEELAARRRAAEERQRQESARRQAPAAPESTPAPTTPMRRALPSTPPGPRPADPPVAAPPAPSADWAVVPVFFGTDRSRLDLAKRIGYGANRGHRLEVGRALITVPKAHQVPNVERPWVIKVPYTGIVLYQEAEDPKRHFTIQELRALSKEALLELIRDRLRASRSFQDQALVFVHGYNNGFDDALFRTAQIAYDLNYDGAPFLYSWPSGAGISGYPYDRESAQQAEQYLKQFLLMVLNETGAKNVSIIAHSMGNQLLLQVLRDLKRSNPEVARINQIILAAPDVDRDSFQFLATQINGIGRGITMYASSNDVALGISRRFAGGVPRAGDVPMGVGPMIVSGIDTIDVSALSTDYLALNHSSYAEKTGLLKDIELVLRTGTRPPEIRLPLLERVKGVLGDYWRYPR